MHSMAKACAKGDLTECGCDKSQPSATASSAAALRSRAMLKYQTSTVPSMSIALFPSTPTPQPMEGFEWGGCSDDLKYGRNVSTSFIDGQESFVTRRRIVRMVNLHNNEAGRQVCTNERGLPVQARGTLVICIPGRRAKCSADV